MKKFLKVVYILLLIIAVGLVSGYIYMQKKFPAVGEAPNIKIEPTEQRLARGKYLFNSVAGCADCHSTRDWSKLTGPIVPGTAGKGGEPFDERIGLPGSFPSKNITPAALGNWTDGEIYRAITSGVSKDGEPLFPIMPYPNFAKMDKEDIYSIIAYLRTLAPIQNEVPKHDAKFPMNLIMRTIPAPPDHQPIPDRSNTVAYGKYLVTSAGCGECHSQSDKGVPVAGKEFAGGVVFDIGPWINQSANITPDNETGIGKWTKEDFIKRFKSCSTPEYKNTAWKEGEFQTIMPWTFVSQMSEEDLGAIYDYLHSLPAVKNSVEKFKPGKK
ncbi:MAG: cytochrome c [Ignavibacteria bacterium]|nr:cytochrome c [Ignavibacteria bacterium]